MRLNLVSLEMVYSLLRCAQNLNCGHVTQCYVSQWTRLDALYGEIVMYGWQKKAVGQANQESGLHLINEVEMDGTTDGDVIEFATIPQLGYRRLIVKGLLRSDKAADNSNVIVYMNEDTTAANYLRTDIGVANGTMLDAQTSDNVIGNMPAISSPSGCFTSFEAVIERPEATYNKKTIKASSTNQRTTAIAIQIDYSVYSLNITDAITRLRFADFDGNELEGVLTLYGEY